MAGSDIVATDTERVELALNGAFRISRGSTVSTTNHLVTVTDSAGRVGLGGAAPAAYYDEDGDSVAAALPALLAAVEAVGDPGLGQDIEERLAGCAPAEGAARAAVSTAVQDLRARQRGEPLYRRWGLDPGRAPVTSVTVGIDDPAGMAEHARDWREAGYPALKVKLGTDDDRRRLRAVREAVPEARLRSTRTVTGTPERQSRRCPGWPTWTWNCWNSPFRRTTSRDWPESRKERRCPSRRTSPV